MLGLPREFVFAGRKQAHRGLYSKCPYQRSWHLANDMHCVTRHVPSTVQVTELGNRHHISTSIIAERNAVKASCSARAMPVIDTVNTRIITPY